MWLLGKWAQVGVSMFWILIIACHFSGLVTLLMERIKPSLSKRTPHLLTVTFCVM